MAFLSRKPWLPESFSDIQEGIIQTAGLAICSTICIRNALLTVHINQKAINRPGLQRITSRVLTQKKRVNEQTRYLEQKEIV
ncbi:MAG TPA: hypothetical protein VNB54_12510 [Alphaproteobacteria bacterium]|nr:hypothetical protein [Alphaproteobacteria bacterium]